MGTTLKYPGAYPGPVSGAASNGGIFLGNTAIRCTWALAAGRVAGLTAQNQHSGQVVSFAACCLPRVTIGGKRCVDLASMHSTGPIQLKANRIEAFFRDEASGLALAWSAELKDDANALVQSLRVTALRDTEIRAIVFVDALLHGARQVGSVSGSVVVCGDVFMGVEHPLAENVVHDSRVRCALPLDHILKAGTSVTYTFGIGVVPPGQLRRGFAYYIEQRRIFPYRQFLHYNNWYDVWLGRATERMTEAEALAAIDYFGKELVEKRGVKLDAVVWDDGWDDFNTLWDFHAGFPEGFKNLEARARQYGLAQGVWMSPNGGYASAKAKRIAYGAPLGYETNPNGYAMGGPNYRKAFTDVCLRMIREQGVVFFKFDGMGEGGSGKQDTAGTCGALSEDIHAVLELARDLHREKVGVYVSATVGTWASPYWLLYVDNVWRQGGDSGRHGAGNPRQQWITYRDMFCYERVVEVGPLYPINALMLHGILIGERPGRAPAALPLDEQSVADEIWSFFASGTCLQELYVSPDVPSTGMLEHLAQAAKWARTHEDVLVDAHWVGGNPGTGEIYGRAAWQPGRGILSLRNPSAQEQAFTFTLREVWEIPDGVDAAMTLRAIYPQDRELMGEALELDKALTLMLQPFETIVLAGVH
ncbi:MAG: enterotoxin [Kiritimatiellia bacterium]